MPRAGPGGASDPRQVCPHLQGPQRIQISLNIVQVGVEAHVKLSEAQPAYSSFSGASVESGGAAAGPWRCLGSEAPSATPLGTPTKTNQPQLGIPKGRG